MALDRDAAVRAFEPLAERLGQTVEETAAGVHRIMNSHMADLLRSSTIERGHDPRDFALFAYGGAGRHPRRSATPPRPASRASTSSATRPRSARSACSPPISSTRSSAPGRSSTPFGEEDFAGDAEPSSTSSQRAAEAQLAGDGEDLAATTASGAAC